MLGDGIVGVNSIGKILYINLRNFSQKFIEVKTLHLTFHLGSSNSLRIFIIIKNIHFGLSVVNLMKVNVLRF